MKKLVIILVGVLAVAGVVVFRAVNKGPVNISRAEAVEVEAGELYNVYLSDSTTATALYTGKVVQVTGDVSSVTPGNTDRPPVVLLRTSLGNAFINCTFDKKAALPQTGSKVIIRGVCSGIGEADADLGINGDVYLERCIVKK